MRRTQLYLDETLWNVLHTQARSAGVTVSELVRQAVRERYLGNLEERKAAMQAFVGVREESSKAPDSTEYVRRLRGGRRLDRLGHK